MTPFDDATDRELRFSQLVGERRAAARARLMTRIAGLVGWEVDAASGRIVHDDGLQHLFGLPGADLDGTIGPFLGRIHPDDLDTTMAAFEQAKTVGGQYRTEFRLKPEAGQPERWLSGVGEGMVAENGRLVVVGYNADLSREKAREASLQAALERNYWLRLDAEHRIKNHLQLVSSLLHTQARAVAGEDARAALLQAADRLHTIARIHQVLSDLGAEQTVRLDWVLSEVASQTLAATAPPCGADLKVDCAAVTTSAGFATSVAQMLAELITNAVKHAPRDRRLGVEVLTSVAGPMFSLRVVDDGDGLPAGFDMNDSRGVGLKVVRAVSRTLGGTVKPTTGPGASFLFTCRLPADAQALDAEARAAPLPVG